MALIDTPSGPRPAEPGLECALLAGERGEMTMEEVLRVFVGWPVFVPSTADPAVGSAGVQPVILNSGDGSPLVAVFTSEDRIGAFAEQAPYLIELSGGMVATASTNGAGIVINPNVESQSNRNRTRQRAAAACFVRFRLPCLSAKLRAAGST